MHEPQKQTLLIDGDDTLWKAQELYRNAERVFRDRLAAVVGLRPETIQAKFDEINDQLASSQGFREQRYSRAMEQTYEYFANQQGIAIDPVQQEAIQNISRSVFTLTPDLITGTQELLSSLADGYTLIFYSGGDEQIQRSRLEHLGLAPFFSDARIVAQKNEEELHRLLEDFGLSAQNTWVIGNSPRFDISPALRLGLRAIWLYSDLWENE